MDQLKQYITEIPDFPQQGILFRDISPLLRDHFKHTIDMLCNLFTIKEWQKIDVIAGIDARGFILAGGLAYKHNKGLVKIRKAGKLPNPAAKIEYGLEYGKDALEMQHGSGKLLIVDDVLATGGTLKAAAELCEKSGYDIQGIATLINIASLNDVSWYEQKIKSLVVY